MLELDATDLLLLAALRQDSRLSLRDLGKKASISAPSVASRLKRLEEAGIIIGYTVQLAQSRFALDVEALINISVPRALYPSLLHFADGSLNVISCLRLTGRFSHQIHAAFADMKHLSQFVEELNERFGDTETSLILSHEIPERQPLSTENVKLQ
ncbi:MAG: Lrp/AsnC family transcriptional regulator [Succinivibrio sp.]|nr:Lrp/AsnC family transcriptional regulator [Succinivibrio sp.]